MDVIYRYYSLDALMRMAETLLADPHVNHESLAEVRRIRREVECRYQHDLWVHAR